MRQMIVDDVLPLSADSGGNDGGNIEGREPVDTANEEWQNNSDAQEDLHRGSPSNDFGNDDIPLSHDLRGNDDEAGFGSGAVSDFHEHESNDLPSGLRENEFTENVWKMEVKKDIAALYKQNEKINKSLNEMNRLLQNRKIRCSSPSSRYSTSDEEIKFAMLPDFQLEKVWEVKTMEENVNRHGDYRKLLVKLIFNLSIRVNVKL